MAEPTPTIKRSLDDWKVFCDQVQNSTAVALTETPKEQGDRKKKALKDYNFFVKTYFPIYADTDCADFQVKAAKKILKDKDIVAVLEWAREHAKSVHATIFIPMWLMCHKQLTGMILMGKNQDDACNLLSDIQAQLQYNEIFIHDWGQQYNMGSWEEGEFTTKDGIRFLSLGRDQSPRGARAGEKRPNYAVIDDVDDDIIVHSEKRTDDVLDRIMSGLYFALSIKGSRLVMSGNRIHPRSILAKMVGDITPNTPKRKGIYHSKVYASHVPGKPHKPLLPSEGGVPSWNRYTAEELQKKIDKAGTVRSNKEFYHTHSVDGKVFKEEKFHWTRLPRLDHFQVIEGYLDPSFENKATSDFKAVGIWGVKDSLLWCIKKYCRRSTLEEVFMWIMDFDNKLPEGVGVIWRMEQQFITQPIKFAMMQAERDWNKLRHNQPGSTRWKRLNIISDNRKKENKYVRMVKMEPQYTGNIVRYNAKETHDPDMIEGNNQLKGIEPGYKSPDDSPDADEGAWFYLLPHLTATPGDTGYRLGARRSKTRNY